MAKRPYLDASTMRPIYDKYQRSGQTIKAFCVAEQLKRHTFNYWRLKFVKQVSNSENSFQQIHSIQKKASSSGVIRIRIADRVEIALPVDYDPAALHQLIQGLIC